MFRVISASLFVVSTASFAYGPACAVASCIIYTQHFDVSFLMQKITDTREFLYVVELKKKTRPYIISIRSSSTYSCDLGCPIVG